MSHKFQEFIGRSCCHVCESRACTKPGFCDDSAQVDRAIITCANVGGSVTLQECLDSKSFKGMDEGQIYLAYVAGEILARKR